MKTITGTFTLSEGEPSAGDLLTLELSHAATEIATGAKVEGFEIEIALDESGAIPPNTEIPANDELTAGTYYAVTLKTLHGIHYYEYYNRTLKIVGDSPINLNALIPLGPDELQQLQNAASPCYNPPKPEPKLARQMPSPRKLGINTRGFFAGVINCPPTVGDCTPSHDSTFPAFTFTLPIKAVVSCISVIVVVPHAGRHVVVALYDANGDKACTASILADRAGVCTGAIERTMTLHPGEYTIVWSTGTVKVQGLGNDYREQLQLMNGGDGGVVAGIVNGGRGVGTLPDKLGEIIPTTSCLPILAYFKA